MTTSSAITRRTTLAGLSAAAAVAVLPRQASAASPLFRHGVASGDPDATSVVLWTRVSAAAPLMVDWELAADAKFARIVGRAG